MPTQAQVAEHLGISQQAVSKLVSAKVFTTNARGGLDIDRCRIAYVTRLREEAAGRSASVENDDGLDLVAERARLAKEQADRVAMENKRMRGELVRVADAVRPFGQALARVRSRLLAVPAEQSPSIHRLKTIGEIRDRLSDIVHDILTELSNPGDYIDEARGNSGTAEERGDDGQEGGDDARDGIGSNPRKPRAAAARRSR